MSRHPKHYPEFIDLAPVAHATGAVHLPGSKSISNRSLLLAALADGVTEIRDLLASDDTLVMLSALQKLGVHWQQHGDASDYRIEGVSGAFPVRQADLFMGNAGTAIRPLTAVLAVLGGDYTLHGVTRMHERPIGDLIDALNAIGAHIEYMGNSGYPPLHIRRGAIHAHALRVRGNVSSQFLTALLMASPLIAHMVPVVIEVEGELISKPYIEITLNMMQHFGVEVARGADWQCFEIAAGQCYRSPGMYRVEGDASSASYFLAAGAIAGGPVRVVGVGQHSIQGDVLFPEMLEKMGATVVRGENWIEVGNSGALRALDADCNAIPDAAMTLAVAALFAEGVTTLRNIRSWLVKETDRLAAMACELQKLGATVEEGPDWLRITPPEVLREATIATYDDHRMAMCFSLAALDGRLRRGAKVRILEPACVAKTFPDYFEIYSALRKGDVAESTQFTEA